MKAWAVERHVAKRRSEGQRSASFAAQRPRTVRAAPSLGDECRGLGRDEALLGVRQKLLALIKGETDRLELAMMLVEREYLRVVAQDLTLVADDPQSDLDTHDCRPPG